MRAPLFFNYHFNFSAHPLLRRLSMRRGTLEALANRRTSVLAEQRKSMQAAGSVYVGNPGSEAADAARARERRRLESVVSWRDATA